MGARETLQTHAESNPERFIIGSVAFVIMSVALFNLQLHLFCNLSFPKEHLSFFFFSGAASFCFSLKDTGTGFLEAWFIKLNILF